MLLSTLAATLLGNMFADKPKIPRWGALRASKVIRAGEGTIRASQDS